jgi:hypothetical protein
LLRSLAILVFSLAIASSCGTSEEEEDCKEAKRIWGSEQTQALGEECYAGSYGACPDDYSDCAEGECRYSDSAGTSICTQTCTSHKDCGDHYCKDEICQPPASCDVFCDEVCCCTYGQDPEDPTQCVQISCQCS